MNATLTLSCTALQTRLDDRVVLQDVDLEIGSGWTAIVGPNGAGKSTLLRSLAGLLRPQGGQVRWNGVALDDIADGERAQRLAWLPQADTLSGDLSVWETVSLGRLPHTGLWGRWRREDQEAVLQAMHRTDCLPWAERSMQHLSGGERQRVHLARALATGACALLLDEPTAHLDPPHQWALARLFRELSATHTVVTVLHDLTLALQADAVIGLDSGRVLAHAAHDDPRLHRQLERLFAPAVRIQAIDTQAGRYGAVPAPLD